MTVQLVPTSQYSEEYGRIEYELQLQLNAPRLTVSECYDFGNPRVQSEFQKFCKTMPTQNIVDVFMATSDIHQPVSDISLNGIKVDPTYGFKFRVGSFEINKSKEIIEVIRLQIALGVTLNYQKQSPDLKSGYFTQDVPLKSNLLPGYDSLCISDHHDFVIFNSCQIKTCNLIKFNGGENLDPANDQECLCDLCNTEPATIWCVNDSAKLCAKCDESSHSLNKILEKHKRIKLTEARVMMEFCPIHPEEKAEFYCSICQAPVCITCKMSGSHSKGKESTHPLVPLRIAYSESIENSKKDDEELNKKIDLIDERIAINEQKRQKILQNCANVEEEIMRLASIAIEESKQKSGDKILLINSAQTELKRKKNELLLNANFLDTQKNSVGPLAFLKAFSRHNKISAELNKLDDIQPEVQAEADLCVFGSIEVKSASQQRLLTSNELSASSNVNNNVRNSSPSKHKYQSAERRIRSNENSESENDNDSDNDINRDYKAIHNQAEDEDNSEIESKFGRTDKKNRSFNNQSPGSISPSNSPQSVKEKKLAKSKLQSFEIPKSRLPEYSTLTDIARRKSQKLKKKGFEIDFQPFQGSSILKDQNLCKDLYMCFPFRTLPRTHLLFSTERDGRSISTMHSKIDDIGISTVLVKNSATNFIFGGFAAAKWNSKGVPFGDKSSTFLFSLTRDAFIPYRPRVKDACYLFATEDELTFGKHDLVLAEDFDHCEAVIENSFGIGLQHDSVEAKVFLAGEPEFVADVVEVWGFFTTES